MAGPCTPFLSWWPHVKGNSQKFIANNDLSVVSVLVYGHAYHAECLESMTLETDKYDPVSPSCMAGDKHSSKLSRKGFRADSEIKAKNHRISRNRVIDSYVDADFDGFYHQKDIDRGGKVPKVQPSSSARSSFGKPFLRRHFLLGSKWNQSLLESDYARKKGFWGRY